MTDMTFANAGLEYIAPQQRMIGLLLAPGLDGKSIFESYSELTERLAENDSGIFDQKPSEDTISRLHQGGMERSRPIFSLYKVYCEEVIDELVSPWFVTVGDFLERSYLNNDKLGVFQSGQMINSLPERYILPADRAQHWMLQARACQLFKRNTLGAFNMFERAFKAFSEVIQTLGALPYLRYQRLLAMEGMLNTQYQLDRDAGKDKTSGDYLALVEKLHALGLQTEMEWALQYIGPYVRRAYSLAEMIAVFDQVAAQALLKKAIMLDPRLAHFDKPPFPDEEAIKNSLYLGPVAKAMEVSEAALLEKCRALEPSYSAIARVKYSGELRDSLEGANDQEGTTKGTIMKETIRGLVAAIALSLLVPWQFADDPTEKEKAAPVMISSIGPPVTFEKGICLAA